MKKQKFFIFTCFFFVLNSSLVSLKATDDITTQIGNWLIEGVGKSFFIGVGVGIGSAAIYLIKSPIQYAYKKISGQTDLQESLQQLQYLQMQQSWQAMQAQLHEKDRQHLDELLSHVNNSEGIEKELAKKYYHRAISLAIRRFKKYQKEVNKLDMPSLIIPSPPSKKIEESCKPHQSKNLFQLVQENPLESEQFDNLSQDSQSAETLSFATT